MAMNDREEITEYNKSYYKYEELMKEFPLLYGRRKLPMTQTCMCWGIDCGEGWYNPIRDLSFRLECLNYAIGKKWGFRIEAEQVKEKYGTLRFYYNVRPVSSWYRNILSFPFRWLAGTGYNLKSDGVEYKVSRFLFNMFFKIGEFIRWKGLGEHEKKVVLLAIDKYVEKLIAECDGECYKLCEKCGNYIGTEYSPRCETYGWVSYLCENCAKKTGANYTVVVTPQEKVQLEQYQGEMAKKTLKRVGRVYNKGEDITERLEEERKKHQKESKAKEKREKSPVNDENDAKPKSSKPRKAKAAK